MAAPTLELHYHLKDDSHAMDAFIRNKCEAEALAVFSYIADRLGIDIRIESLARGEGGLKEFLQFGAKPEVAWTITVMGIVLPQLVAIWNAPPKPDKELEAINKESAKSTLEERRIAVEKARIELQKLREESEKPPAAATPAPTSRPRLPPPTEADRSMQFMTAMPLRVSARADAQLQVAMAVYGAINVIAEEPKFTIRRSNFFKTLLPYDKVIAVGLRSTGLLDPEEFVIPKRDFLKYVLKTDKLPSETIEEALITIVAPVIDGSGMMWKGIYENEPVSFTMADTAFKEQVVHRRVSFQHGDAIRCNLTIDRKLDETGEVVITSRSVQVVLEKIDQDGTTETTQGKKKRFETKLEKSQGTLDLGSSGADRS